MLGIVPVAVLVFLATSQFFVGWQGQVVSVAPPPVQQPDVLTVRIVSADRQVVERSWSAELVRRLEVPFDAVAVPPPTIPAERPATHKAPLSLSFQVTIGAGEEATELSVPTTSPKALGLAALVFFGLVALRNMMWSGSPVSLARRGVYLPPNQAQAGVPVRGQGPGKQPKVRGKKGPPPSRRRRR